MTDMFGTDAMMEGAEIDGAARVVPRCVADDIPFNVAMEVLTALAPYSDDIATATATPIVEEIGQ